MGVQRVTPRARVLATGSALPDDGRLGEGETTSDLAARASRSALEAAGLTPADLDMIVMATSTGDAPLPATAARLQQKIGAELIPSFDVNASSAGFLYGLAVANHFVANGKCRTVLVVAADAPTRFLAPGDDAARATFGDAAGAAIVGASDGANGLLAVTLHADGDHGSVMEIPGGGSAEPLDRSVLERGRHHLRVDSSALEALAIDRLPGAIGEALAMSGLPATAVDWVIPQDAAPSIVDALVTHAQLPESRFIIEAGARRNALGATIPVALDRAWRAGTIRPGQAVLLVGLGAGVAWGSAVLTM